VTIRPEGGDSSGRPVTAAPPPAPRGTAPTPVTGPLALQPQAAESATPRVRTVTVARPPPEITSSTSGGYVVQLSSQKTEAEAQAVFRSLQAKFPNELGDRQPLIKRADLGGKGVVYRTQVGPFPSAQEANRFCAGYKAAGGQCFVP
jgi:cell division septation protein DedD